MLESSIKDEILSLKKDMKSAFTKLERRLEASIRKINKENDIQCITLCNTVSKLRDKIDDFETKLRKRKKKTKSDSPKNDEITENVLKSSKVSSVSSSVDEIVENVVMPSKENSVLSSIQDTATGSGFDTEKKKSVIQSKTKTPFLSQPKVLYVGDSVGLRANFRHLENSTKCRVRPIRADSSIVTSKSSYHNIVGFNLENPGREAYDYLVMSAPTNDITVKDMNIDPKKQVFKSCENIVDIAKNTLKKHRNLKKIIIMEHQPRFDNQLNSKLAHLANTTLKQIVGKLGPQIVIGEHNLASYGIGKTYSNRYHDERSGSHDGIHLFGKTGIKDYTDSLKSIFQNPIPEAQNKRNQMPFLQPITTQNRYEPLSQGNF